MCTAQTEGFSQCRRPHDTPLEEGTMNDPAVETPAKKVPRRRQQLTATFVGQVIRSRTPAPVDEIVQAIRRCAELDLIDPEDGLIHPEFTTAKAIGTTGALARLREMGLSKPEISTLQVEIAGGKSK